MLDIAYAVRFVRQYKKLPPDLQREVKEKIALFRDKKNHESLRVHKLTGKLKGKYSFSINYQYRITFVFWKNNEALLLRVGDHDIYH